MAAAPETAGRAAAGSQAQRRRPSAVRFAFRELRGGLRGFYVFLACIALGVAAIAGVGSVTRVMGDAIASQGKAILGGDIAFTLVERQARAEERQFLSAAGALSEVAALTGMARKADDSDAALVEVKAVDDAYPLYGDMTVKGGDVLGPLLVSRDGGYGAVAEEALLIRLGLKLGDPILLGKARLVLTGIVDAEPDRLSSGADFGPRLMVSRAALEATGLVQPGSIISWLYRVKLPAPATSQAAAALSADATRRFPDAGWRVTTSDDASPGLKRDGERLAEFLTLVGLSALIVGGVGVANAVSAYLDGKRDVIATLKCLGAPAGFIVRVYLLQILVLAGFGVLIGIVIGAIIPFIVAAALRGVLPIAATASVYPSQLLLAAADGLATALAFALWPLGRARDVPPTALFRDRVAPRPTRPRLLYGAGAATAALALAALGIGFAEDRAIAVAYAGAAIGSFVLLRLVAWAIMTLARSAPPVRSIALRFALANIHRPGALTPAVVLSLGLGLTLLTTLMLVDGNLRRELGATIPAEAPSFYFLDIQDAELPAFLDFLRGTAPEGRVDEVPLLRGRITTIAGTAAENANPSPDTEWVLEGDRGLSYSAVLPASARVVAGSWWPADYEGPPLVSVNSDVAKGLGIGVGDTIAVNVLGRDIEARIANLREVEWQSLALDFVLVYSPNTFRGVPQTHLATLTLPGGGTPEREAALLKAASAAYPAVTALRVKEAINRVDSLLGEIVWAILAASSITLVTAALVLAGALAAAQHRRLYDAVVLKTLGATRRRLIAAFGLEYLLLGLATAVFGILAGSLAAWFVLTKMMQSSFVLLPGVALGTAAFAVAVTVGIGLAGTWRVLGAKAAPVLRNL